MHNISKYKNTFPNGNSARKKRALSGALKARIVMCVMIILTFATCLIFGLFNSVTAFADEAHSSNNRTVKAGVFNFDGYHMKDEDGRLTGYGISFLNLVSEYSRLNFQYTGYNKSWGDMLTMLEKGEIDVVTSARKTPDREKLFAFSLPIGKNKTILSIRVDDTTRHRGDYKSYDGMRIGLVAGSSQNQSLEEFASEHDFSYHIEEYGDSDALADDLQSGKIDAILSSNLRRAENEKTLDIIEEADFYAIVRKDDTDLLDEINYAIEQIDINEGDWQNVLFYQYYGPVYSSALSFTDREKDYISKVVSGEKSITVTAFGARLPYSYTENGELKGIMIDYFAELMKLANLPYEVVVPKDNNDYDELVKNGVNVIIDSTGSDDSVEDSVYRGFNTNSYMTASITRVTRQDHSDKIKTIAVPDLLVDSLQKHGFLDGYTIQRCSGGEEAVQAVLNKKADAAYTFVYTAQLFSNRNRDTLNYTVLDGISMTFSMQISEDTDHELITILNKCIKQTSDDTLNGIASEYLAYSGGDMTLWEYMQEHPEIIILVVIAFALVVGVIVVLCLRGYWNKKLLQTTEQANKEMGEQLAIVEALSRDYTNVFAVDEEKAIAHVVKLEGYDVTEGIKKDTANAYGYATILDNYIQSRVHPDDRAELAKELALDTVKEKLKTEGEFSGSYRILDNGEVHNFQYTYTKINDSEHGRGSFILVGFRNIDEMIRKEQEQKEVLAEALAQAQYANKAKTSFLNNMSHDIRTPMNAIIGFTSLAATHLDNKDQIRDYLSKIMTSGNHLLSLINDVLDMSRIESGKVKIDEKETRLPDIMHDLKTIVQADIKAKQLEFYIDTLDVTNETIVCDKLRLNQVLLNLLSNAMKYTKPGGMVSVRVIQTADASDGYASYKFSVKDTGIGMSKEFLQHVFEPFEREQTSTVSGIQGTGLGLAITKNIVDMMGGTITVDSEIGKGSEFIATFRFRVVDGPVEPQRLEPLENLRALVVDDDVNTCVSVSKMLTTIGMRPDWTTLGHEAVVRTEFALEQNEPYSAYIIDWLMPDMNGIELVRRIRRIIGDLTPVIILTAYDWTDIEKEAKEAGVTAFCSKPIFLSELRSILAAPYMEQESTVESEKAELRFDGKKLLLVEDNELNQEIAQTILEMAGFVVDTADDGSVAVEQMKKMPAGTYDLILMDIQMPIMNGYEATRAIRALKSKKKASIPIVAMTANAFDEHRKEAIEAGMDGYTSKPIDIDKLMNTLNDILK